MFSEWIKKCFRRQPFILLLCLSAIIHVGLIASYAKIRDVLWPLWNQTSIDSTRETTIEFVLHQEADEEIYPVMPEAVDIADAIAEDSSDPDEARREQFVDTSQLRTDEENQTETNRIGEKGSVARDQKLDGDDVNGEAFSEGEAEMLSLERGGLVYTEGVNNVSVQQPAMADGGNDTNEADTHESKRPAESRLPEPAAKGERDADERLGNKQYDGKKEVDPGDTERLARDDETKSDKTERMGTEGDELQTFDSEFERIIPEPEEAGHTMAEQGAGDKSGESRSPLDNNKDGNDGELTALDEIEREKVVKEISELYNDNGKETVNESLQDQPTVSMSVNGKSALSIPAPSLKADLSNSALLGVPSFNIKKNEYASYYKHIRDKISLYWLLYFGTDQSIKLKTQEGRPIIIEFKITPSGKITEVLIAEDAGNPFLASRAQLSVSKTQLDKFPPVVEEEFIDVRFNFYFF